ncbi:MAG: hypothetical protein ACI8W8_002828 [Rhodothermales bacterium]|jgi:hypothetical protein
MKRLLAHSLLLAAALAHGSSQNPERIRYNNADHLMHTLPLEGYFSDTNPRPQFLEETSSSCWRGYLGRWEIRDGSLYLASMKRGVDGPSIALSAVFPGAKGQIKADWYTGTLRLPQGEIVRPVHMGFGTRFEWSIHIEIEKGAVVSAREEKYDALADAYRSESDLEFVAMLDIDPGSAPPEDDGEWVDGRLMKTPLISKLVKVGDAFRTRGIVLPAADKTFLWIPDTPKTKQQYLPVSATPVGLHLRPGMHAEVTGRFASVEARLQFHATAIRELAPGETIHHAKFADQIAQLTRAPTQEAGD